MGSEKTTLPERPRPVQALLSGNANRSNVYLKSRADSYMDALEAKLAAAQAYQLKRENEFEAWIKQYCTDEDGIGNPPPEHVVYLMQRAWQAATAAQAAIGLQRENEQSALDAATVEERFALRERVEVMERALENAAKEHAGFAKPSQFVGYFMASAAAELAKEKANVTPSDKEKANG